MKKNFKKNAKDNTAKNFWIYGVNPINSVLKKRPHAVKKLIIAKAPAKDSKETPFSAISGKSPVNPEYVDFNRFLEITGLRKDSVHQSIAALIDPPAIYDLKELVRDKKEGTVQTFLMLDGLTDPRNLGAIIRTASACGISAIIVPKDRTARIDAAVYKTSAGEIENVRICEEVNLSRTIKQLQDNFFMVYGLDEDAENGIYSESYTGDICCVVGGEDTGIRRLVSEHCDKILNIPMAGKAHSLNASVAAAVFMYEVFRQRMH